jgi:hypothetical protein
MTDLANAVRFANLTPAECCALANATETTISPASTIAAQLAVTLDNLGAQFPAINVNRLTAFAVAYLEAHPVFAGRTVATA